ncbi:glycoside hydrolase family 13 protein [Leuconostoc gelidum]|uniref:glycoside hydrolase family 13 protein n=1 Tax=Leuconostoc gelidum TaxID=1244 RepID=UPI0002193D1D|nr:glycoside hydrolase family 13 protein [Leuconostoc gelidum]AFS40588.1 neopullulanase [Leuconostoc gelidum JB7]MBZ5978486.1 alpha-glycosidase [Leuconostoc gelidum subsp. gelidum]MBZ5991607.1 alpha-glycosidase [Leuconostoc gelidum subsp. gelidum]USP17984.1 alpha-glycosidase [Leuconostoc gelidum subsp. aenigmaticum]GMA68042.1 alpha-glycosidase [Leuconostoc gelidum subsp. gelidum]
MNKAAIYHRPESEYAYLYTKKEMRVRLRTALDDIKTVTIVSGDPYNWTDGTWQKYADISMKKTLATDTHQYWETKLSAATYRLNYGFLITDTDEQTLFFGDRGFESITKSADENDGLMGASNYFKMPYFQEIDRFKAPDWVKSTIWYQIFPERFANGDHTNDNQNTLPWDSERHPTRTDFYGGDLRGIINHLDHLIDLGINGIYFTPIFKSPTNHKYDTQDYLTIDPQFGTKKDFKELVKKAHDHGIKIMLDAVFNHIGDKSPQWQDVLKNGQNSKYADWFHVRSWPATYTATNNFEETKDATYDTFAFTPHMPKLNTANIEVQDYLLNIATYWIKEFNIDAWRLDVANEVDHHFWKRFKQATTAIKPDFYIIGEIWTSAQSWLQGDEFTGVMNYAFTSAISDFFAKKQITATQMINQLNNQLLLNRDQTNQMMFNLLDSHDAPRILSVAKNNKNIVKQMFTFMFLQQGTPDIYYGTEYGMTGDQDPDNRKPMVWNKHLQDHEMYDYFKKLIKLRRNYQIILTDGNLSWSNEDSIVGLNRTLKNMTITALFNTTDSDYTVVKQPNSYPIFFNQYQHETLSPDGFVVFIHQL